MDSSINTILLPSADYPLLLKEISDAPDSLRYCGALPDTLPLVAIVGTRKASAEARALAKDTAEVLSRNGFGVVSGLAFGVDASAHEGAMRGGTPTFAVLGNGLPSIYPSEHEHLAEDIVKSGGGIFSEYEANVPAFRNHFLERNRIVSGLSLAVVLIEVPIRSGALSTARHALLQGRDVLVFANRPSNHRYEGSHMLLREGARFISSPQEVLEDVLGTLPQYPHLKLRKLMFRDPISKHFEDASLTLLRKVRDAEEEKVYNELFRAGIPLSVDNLAEITTLEVQVLNRILTNFLLSNIVREEGGRFCLK